MDLPDEVTVTMRAEDAPMISEGAEQRDCAVCEETVVVSPSTQEEIERGVYPDYVICVQCMDKAEE